MQKFFVAALFFFTFYVAMAQGNYAGPVGSSSSIAVYKDSSIIHSWARECMLDRGYMNILDTGLGKTSIGSAEMATGKAMSKGVVSLGDGGIATLTFEGVIFDGPGPDFAVFENGFGDVFLELAFVEVSSDGINFFRFPAISDIDTSTQIASYGTLNTSFIHNLAGKYPIGYGTPFDLSELSNITGVDIQNITHVRIIDVIGSLNDSIASRDSRGVKVNDPFPTPWPNGGFDLDAVAAFYIKPTGLKKEAIDKLNIYPNPVTSELRFEEGKEYEFKLFDLSGKLQKIGKGNRVQMADLADGFYILNLFIGDEIHSIKISKR